MKTEAMVIRRNGGPEVLERAEIDLPEPGPREVRVRVRAVAVNHVDVWTRRGLPNLRYEFPHRLGADAAGEIEALGPGARGCTVGQRVLVAPGSSCGVCERCASGADNLCAHYKLLGENTQGAYARHVIVPDASALPFPVVRPPTTGSPAPPEAPRPLSFVEAASLPVVFLTAWQMVVRRAEVRPGDVVLVQAAGSGVGSAAIQIAKMHGARVLATAGTPEKVARARALGADEAFDYTREDFVKECKRLTDKRGVDAVIEHVGGEVFERSILATRWGGCVVTCGATAGFTPTLDLRHVFFRQVRVLGSTMGPRGDLFRVIEHVNAGKLRPVVDRVMPLWAAADAHRVLEERRAFGKVVLEVD